MTHIEQVFFAVGVFTSIVGAVALTGLIAFQGLEWWIKFHKLRKPLLDFYVDQLRRAKEARDGTE